MIRKLEWTKTKGFGKLIHHTSKIDKEKSYRLTENTEKGILMLQIQGTRIEKNYGYEKELAEAKLKCENEVNNIDLPVPEEDPSSPPAA